MALKIGNTVIGERIYIIAEIGNNHLGEFNLALKTLEAALETGVDAIKFQMFNPESLVTASTPVYKHVPDNIYSTQRERFRQMRLTDDQFLQLAKITRDNGVDFLCTPFDKSSADFLYPLVPAFKIASGDTSNYALIDHVKDKKKPLIVSTGLCDQKEVDLLVDNLPLNSTVLLHCVGSYPTPDDEVNLALIPFFKERYKIPIGFSDHTSDILAPLSAAAIGAVVIEKHFILDRSIPGGDQTLSLVPNEMKKLVDSVRRLEKMMGSSPRKLTTSELYGRTNLRRSPYSNKKIKKGEQLSINDITFLRPEVESAYPISDIIRATKIVAIQDMDIETLLTADNTQLLDE